MKEYCKTDLGLSCNNTCKSSDVERYGKQNIGLLFNTFSILYLSSSFCTTTGVLPSFIVIAWWLVCLVSLVFKRKKLDALLFITVFFIGIIVVMSSLINGEELTNSFKRIFTFLVVAFYINTYSYSEIRESFISVILFLACFSIPFYFISMPHPTVFNSLIMYGPKGTPYYNFFFYCHDLMDFRDGGLFWEPGAFATYINITIMLLLLNEKEKRKIVKLLVLVFVDILTFSTTGYITLALLFVMYICTRSTSKLEKAIVICSIGVIVYLMFNIYSAELFGTTSRYTFGKLKILFDGNAFSYSNNDLNSVSVRINSIIKPFEIFLQHPLLGVGYDKLQQKTLLYTRGAITCTYVNWFALYGLFYGLIMVIGYVKMICFAEKRVYVRALIALFFLIALISENYASNACFVCIALMGYKYSRNRMVYKINHEQ